MKKQIIALSVLLGITLVMTSCDSKSRTPPTTTSNNEQMAVDTVGVSQPVSAVYQCPMKCEGEKTYDNPGKCPKCNMDLKEMESHQGHKH